VGSGRDVLPEAGARAFARSANREAGSRIEQALDALRRLPEAPRTQEQGIDLRFDFRNAITQTGSGFRGVLLQRLREAEALAIALGDRRRLGRALDYMSNYHQNTCELDEAVALADRALAIGLEIRDLGLEVAARFHLANAYYELGQHRQAAEQLRGYSHAARWRPRPGAIRSRRASCRPLSRLACMEPR
jgi:tetratricopeptide (TPR) repeat protein